MIYWKNFIILNIIIQPHDILKEFIYIKNQFDYLQNFNLFIKRFNFIHIYKLIWKDFFLIFIKEFIENNFIEREIFEFDFIFIFIRRWFLLFLLKTRFYNFISKKISTKFLFRKHGFTKEATFTNLITKGIFQFNFIKEIISLPLLFIKIFSNQFY